MRNKRVPVIIRGAEIRKQLLRREKYGRMNLDYAEINHEGRNEMSIQLDQMPKLGFGLMRLPEKEGEIDLEHVCRMADAYIRAGMNYFDTAYVYHGGNSEKAVKEVLAKRYPRQEKFEELVQLDLNSVDTATLKRVPGIASYRAR